jgi:hypothetical protein
MSSMTVRFLSVMRWGARSNLVVATPQPLGYKPEDVERLIHESRQENRSR